MCSKIAIGMTARTLNLADYLCKLSYDRYTMYTHMQYVTEFEDDPKKSGQKQELFRTLWGSDVGFQVLAPIVICLTLGLVLDNLLHIKPVLTVLFLFLGMLGSFYTIYKIIERERNASRKH